MFSAVAIMYDPDDPFHHDVELVADLAPRSNRLTVGIRAVLDQLRHSLETFERDIGEHRHLVQEQSAFDRRERRAPRSLLAALRGRGSLTA
jgi:hypothetical protein